MQDDELHRLSREVNGLVREMVEDLNLLESVAATFADCTPEEIRAFTASVTLAPDVDTGMQLLRAWLESHRSRRLL